MYDETRHDKILVNQMGFAVFKNAYRYHDFQNRKSSPRSFTEVYLSFFNKFYFIHLYVVIFGLQYTFFANIHILYMKGIVKLCFEPYILYM